MRVGVAAALLAPCAMAQAGGAAGQADRAVTPPTAEPLPVYTPMNSRERLHYYLTHMFSPEAFLRSAAGAGINQALDIPHAWGQGAEGYGRRYASSFGAHMVQATLMYGAGDVLHEDNRYFRSGLASPKARLKYAVASTFLARHDDGTRHFSFSRVGSYAGAAAISRLWQPSNERGGIHVVDSFAIFIAAETGFNVAREFLPGIFHSRPPVTQSAAP